MARKPGRATYDDLLKLPEHVVGEIIDGELLPHSSARDRAAKPGFYARIRVPHFWVIDPIVRTLEVFRLQGENDLLIGAHADAEKVRAEPFDAVELDMSAWWTPATAQKERLNRVIPATTTSG